jgi:hypothetical protein
LIQAYTWACADAGHVVCLSPSACEKFADSASRTANAENRATSFDARRAALERRDEMPDHSWTTTELLARVEELFRAQPNIDGPFRTIAITTGLARLGERGLPVDWLVRDRIGPGLIRRVILGIAEDAPPNHDPKKDLSQVFVDSLSGKTSTMGRRWIEEASISDIRVVPRVLGLGGGLSRAARAGRSACTSLKMRTARHIHRAGPRRASMHSAVRVAAPSPRPQ